MALNRGTGTGRQSTRGNANYRSTGAGQGHRSSKQLRQLEYARQMKGIRARARNARGGQGRINLRGASQKLRRQFGYDQAAGRGRRSSRNPDFREFGKTSISTRRGTRGTTRRGAGGVKARRQRARAGMR